MAAIGAWLAVQGGSLLYLPVGLAILFAGLAIVRSHSIADFVLLVIMTLAMVAWSQSGDDDRARLLGSMTELSGRIDLLLGLLVIMLVALLIAHWCRPLARPAEASVR